MLSNVRARAGRPILHLNRRTSFIDPDLISKRNTMDNKLPDIVEQADRIAPFVYRSNSDDDEYQYILQFMILSTIKMNGSITENQLCSLFLNLYNVPEELCKWCLTILRSVVANNNKLLKISTAIREGRKINHCSVDNSVTTEQLVEQYRTKVLVDLSSFEPQKYRARS